MHQLAAPSCHRRYHLPLWVIVAIIVVSGGVIDALGMCWWWAQRLGLAGWTSSALVLAGSSSSCWCCPLWQVHFCSANDRVVIVDWVKWVQMGTRKYLQIRYQNTLQHTRCAKHTCRDSPALFGPSTQARKRPYGIVSDEEDNQTYKYNISPSSGSMAVCDCLCKTLYMCCSIAATRVFAGIWRVCEVQDCNPHPYPWSSKGHQTLVEH